MRYTFRPRSSARMQSGPVEIRLRIWLSAWVRPFRAEARATRNTRMASTFPSLGLGLTGGIAALGGPGSRDGVLGVGLAVAMPTLAVGSVALDPPDALPVQVTGEPSTIRAGALDAQQLDRTEAFQ